MRQCGLVICAHPLVSTNTYGSFLHQSWRDWLNAMGRIIAYHSWSLSPGETCRWIWYRRLGHAPIAERENPRINREDPNEGKTLSVGMVVTHQVNHECRYLLLRAYNHWDFPKGIVELTEDPFEAARREVEEETSLTNLDFP